MSSFRLTIVGRSTLRPGIVPFARVVLLCLPGAVASDTISGPNPLCTSAEKPLFSCSIGKRTLSVCASPDLSATSGHLQYRFGTSLQKVELSYPASSVSPQIAFRFRSDNGSAHASDDQLSFSIGDVSYTVFVERAAFEWNGSGVLIKSHGKRIAYLLCKTARPAPDKLDELDGLGIPSAELEMDDPDTAGKP